jgi:hypothetical protein
MKYNKIPLAFAISIAFSNISADELEAIIIEDNLKINPNVSTPTQ